jgi:hypothetical protein
MVGGGAVHAPELGRQVAYQATHHSEGIIDIGDLKVTAQTVPGGSVRHAAGGATLLNRSPGGAGQSYVGYNPSEVNPIPITATGGGAGRSDLVIVRVKDPQYPPWPAPADRAVGPYIETVVLTGVPSATKTARELNLGYPAIALARIDIPAGTGTITNAMIKDLRKMAVPTVWRELRAYALVTGDTEANTATGADGEFWPNAAGEVWTIDVPEWAVFANIVCTWSQIKVPAGDAYGSLWLRLGVYNAPPFVETQRVVYDTVNSTSPYRATFEVADDVAIPAALRGGTWSIMPKAQVSAAYSGRLVMDGGSSIKADIEFREAAV